MLIGAVCQLFVQPIVVRQLLIFTPHMGSTCRQHQELNLHRPKVMKNSIKSSKLTSQHYMLLLSADIKPSWLIWTHWSLLVPCHILNRAVSYLDLSGLRGFFPFWDTSIAKKKRAQCLRIWCRLREWTQFNRICHFEGTHLPASIQMKILYFTNL